MPQVIGVIAYAVGATGTAAGLGVTATTVATAAVAATVQVAAVAGSLAYQRQQQRKAKAAAQRLAKQQQAEAQKLKQEQAKQAQKLKRISADADAGTFATAAGPQDIVAMVRHSAPSRRIVYGRARLGGIWFYTETTGDSNETLHLVLGLCEGPVDAIESIFFDDEEVPLDANGDAAGKWAGFVHVSKHLGTPGDPADPTLVAASSRWTAAHKLTGIAYIYVRLTLSLDLFTGIPDISAVVRGKNDVWDPRTNSRRYSTNPALCLNDYLTTRLIGPGITQTDIDAASLIDAANVCDELAPTLLGTEARYSCQGALDLSSTVEDNANLFVQAMNGDLIQMGGLFLIQAGRYQTPTFTIDMDMLAGPIEFSPLPPRRDRANVVKGTFLSEVNAWQKSDFPAVRDAAAVDQDGQEVVSDLSLDLVGSGAQAQRLASMELKQARRARSMSLVCNLMAMPARVGANVILDLPRYSDGGVFRVVESKLSFANDGTPSLALTLLENSPEIYEWSTSDERLINVPPDLSARMPQVSQPTYSPSAGASPPLPASITITTLTTGAVIRYSFASPPQTQEDGTAYSGPVSVSSGQTLYARAFRSGYMASPLAAEAYA